VALTTVRFTILLIFKLN